MRNFLTNMFRKIVKKSTKRSRDSNKMSTQKSKTLSLGMKFWLLPISIKLLIIAPFIIILLVGVISMITVSTHPQSTAEEPVCQVQTTGDSDVSGGVTKPSGDWLKDGTGTNKNAKLIFKVLTQQEGMSDAAAAGALANAKRESNFDPTAKNPGGGVAGVFQWSGWGSTVNGSRISAGGFIKVGDESTLTMDNEMKLTKKELNGGYSKVKKMGKDTSDPIEGAKNWSQYFEGVALSDGQTKVGQLGVDAKAAYSKFGGNDSSSGNSGDSVIDQGTISAGETDANNSNACGGSSDGSQDEGNRGKIFDDNQKGIILTAGLDDPNHIFVNSMNGGPGVHGPGAHDGWDIQPIGGHDSHQKIYSVTDGTIVDLNRGTNGNETFVLVKTPAGNLVQYQEFEQYSPPKSLSKGQKIKAGTQVGTIGDAGNAGGVHFGRYLHFTYADGSTKHNPGFGISNYGATKHTKSPGELLGIKADKWVHSSTQQYTWSQMKSLKNAK